MFPVKRGRTWSGMTSPEVYYIRAWRVHCICWSASFPFKITSKCELWIIPNNSALTQVLKSPSKISFKNFGLQQFVWRINLKEIVKTPRHLLCSSFWKSPQSSGTHMLPGLNTNTKSTINLKQPNVVLICGVSLVMSMSSEGEIEGVMNQGPCSLMHETENAWVVPGWNPLCKRDEHLLVYCSHTF